MKLAIIALSVLTVVFFVLWRFYHFYMLVILWFYEEQNAPSMSEKDIERCVEAVLRQKWKYLSKFF